MIVNTHELNFELFLHSPYLPDLVSNDFELSADLKKNAHRIGYVRLS